MQVPCLAKKCCCLIVFISCLLVGFSTLNSLYGTLSTPGPTVVYLYEQDVVLLGTLSNFIIDFNKILQQNPSQVDIYIGNPTVYNESIFKQGNVRPQSSVLVDREYLTPNSILTIQLQPDNVNETNFIATVAIKVFGTTHNNAETIITNNSKYMWTFNESDYYTIWINSSVQLNYTITGEVYHYNASDLTLSCSIPADQRRCSVIKYAWGTKVYIFGVASATRNTITKLSYDTSIGIILVSTILFATTVMIMLLALLVVFVLITYFVFIYKIET